MTKKKILIIYDELEKNNIIYFLNNIDYKQNEVNLLIEDNIKIKKLLPKKVNIINYNKQIVKKIIFKTKFIINNKNKYDKTFNFSSDDVFLNRLSKNTSNDKTIIINTNNINELNYREYFMKRNIYDFNKIIFKTYEEQFEFLKYYPTLSKKTSVINNVVNYEEIEKLGNIETKEKIKRTDKTILLISDLNEENNNISNTLNIIKELKEEIKNLKLYIIGDGIDKFAYESFIEDNNLEDTIYLLGKRDNIYPYINKCKYILLNTKNDLDKYLYPSIVLKTQVITKCIYADDIINIGENYGYIISNNYKKNKEELKKILNLKIRKNNDLNIKNLNKDKIYLK